MVGWQEEKGHPRVAQEIRGNDLGMVEPDVIQYADDGSPWIVQTDSVQEFLKRCGIAGIGNLSQEFPIFQVDRTEQGLPFLRSIPLGNDRLDACKRPHTGKRR